MMDSHASLHPKGFALDPRSDEEFQTYLREILSNYLHAVFIATRKEEVVGYTIIAEMENPPVFSLKRYGFICEICVDPGCQGEGIGKVLFDRAARWFKRRELNIIQLNVSNGNEAGMKFYNRLGFAPLPSNSLVGYGKQNIRS